MGLLFVCVWTSVVSVVNTHNPCVAKEVHACIVGVALRLSSHLHTHHPRRG